VVRSACDDNEGVPFVEEEVEVLAYIAGGGDADHGPAFTLPMECEPCEECVAFSTLSLPM